MAGISEFCKQLMLIKRALNKESSHEIFYNWMRNQGISYSSQIVFFEFLDYTCFSGTVCPLQVSVPAYIGRTSLK